MLYLLLAVLSSMGVSVLMRLSGRHTKNNLTVLATNYLMCSAAAAVLTGLPLLPSGEGTALTVGLGAVTGVLYLLGFLLLQWNIGRNGLVLPATFQKLGVIVPTVAAVVIFGETARWTQVIGILAALCAILLIQDKSSQRASSLTGLVLLLLAGGTCDVMSKVFETWGNPAHNNHFLLMTFITAMVLCGLLCIIRRQGVTASDLGFGLAIGIPNYFSAHFLLMALTEVPAVVVFPTFSIGTIVLITLVGVCCFRERLDRRKLTALAIILLALLLLNI